MVPKKLPDHCATINQADLASYLSQNVSFLNILLFDFTHSLWGYCIALLKDNHQEIRNMFIQFINKTTTDKNLLRIFWPWINMQTRKLISVKRIRKFKLTFFLHLFEYTMEKMLAFWECGVLEYWVCSVGPGTHKMYNFLS